MLGTIVSEIVPISNGYCFCNVFFLTSYIISFFMPFLFWGIALQWQMYCSLILLLVLAFHIPISQQICIHLVTRKQVMYYVVVTHLVFHACFVCFSNNGFWYMNCGFDMLMCIRDLGFLTLQLKMHILFLLIGLKDFLNISIENSTLLEKVMQVILCFDVLVFLLRILVL